jgi:hypothetical protein
MTVRDKIDSVYYNVAKKLIDVIYKIVSKDVDVPYLQKKYKATRGMVLEIFITHTPIPTKPPVMEIHRFFKVEDGKAVMMDNAEADATVWCELNTMLNMIKGQVVREYQGRRWVEKYNPLDAWAEGKLVVSSPNRAETGWLSDLELLSREIYSQVFPIIQEKLGKKL